MMDTGICSRVVMSKSEVSSAFCCLSCAPVHEGRSRLGCYGTLRTSYPIPSPHLLHDFIVVYTQRGVSRRKKVGQDCCLSSFTPCLGLEVDSERTSWDTWNVMMGIYPDIFRRNPLPEVIFILPALAKYPCHVHQQEF